MQKIKEAKPDCIVNTINGDSNTSFFKELAAQGYTAEKCPVMSFSVAEDELKTLPVELLEGHLAAWNYFMSIKTPANEKFVADFKKWQVEKMQQEAGYGPHRRRHRSGVHERLLLEDGL